MHACVTGLAGRRAYVFVGHGHRSAGLANLLALAVIAAGEAVAASALGAATVLVAARLAFTIRGALYLFGLDYVLVGLYHVLLRLCSIVTGLFGVLFRYRGVLLRHVLAARRLLVAVSTSSAAANHQKNRQHDRSRKSHISHGLPPQLAKTLPLASEPVNKFETLVSIV